LHQIIVGTAGAPFHATYAYDGDNGPYKPVGVFGESQYGYVLVEVEGGHVTMTWKRRTAPGVYAAGGDVFRYTVAAEPKRHATGDVMPAATAPAATPAGNRRSLQRARN
jgi:hypothetical protein